jgi:deazaflavin-dependent oxidoreductase (nitroreductase family)
MADPNALATEEFCYLTTVGRVSGRPHEIEMWFSLHDSTLYMLSGARDRSDWVKNIRKNPNVSVRIDGHTFACKARTVTDPAEEELARLLLVEKYERRPGSLSNWRRSALPVAVDL